MVNTKKLYTVSTIFALTIYILSIFFVSRVISDKYQDIKQFGYDVNDSIVIELKEVSLDKIEETKTSHSKKISKISTNTKKSKSDSRDIKQNDIKSLFSTMRVSKNANQVEEKLKKEKTRASRLKKIKAKELFQSTLNDKNIDKAKILKIKQILKGVKSDKIKGKYDEKYISKISSIIMKLWQNTIGTKDGLKATVIIKIDKNGKLTYRNIEYSLNEQFDTKLKNFLKELETIKFPKYKDRFGTPYIEAEFIFTDKE